MMCLKEISYGLLFIIEFSQKNTNLLSLREARPEGLEPSTSNFGD